MPKPSKSKSSKAAKDKPSAKKQPRAAKPTLVPKTSHPAKTSRPAKKVTAPRRSPRAARRAPAPPRILTISAVAERLKLTPRRIQQLVAEGMPRVTRGKYDADQVLDWYIARLEGQLAGQRGDDADYNYKDEQARDRAAAADLKELKVALQRAELVSIADVEKEITDLVVTTKAAVMAAPARAAPKCIGLEALAIKAVLDDELKQALTKLATRLGPLPEDAAS
jgi:phage terminase Nu1 subunit (DNA packaging protein)